MTEEVSTLEDIRTKYPLYFSREIYEKIEDEIILLFNSTEISTDLLNKCESDTTGIYYHVCAQWWFYKNNNNENHREFNKKARDKKFPRALVHRALFHDDCDSDEIIDLLREAFKLDSTYTIVLGPLSRELLLKSQFVQNSDVKLLLEANEYLNIGIERKDPNCLFVIATFSLINKNFSKARYYNQLSHTFSQLTPYYDPNVCKKQCEELELKINTTKEEYAIKYPDYIEEEYIPPKDGNIF